MADEPRGAKAGQLGWRARVIIVAALVAAVAVVILFKPDRIAPTDEVQGHAPADPAPAAAAETEVAGTGDASARRALPRLVDLGADKCVPCKMMAPILDELREEYRGRFEVVFIDVWKNRDQARKYGIRVIPTQIFFDAEGKELFRHQGYFSRQDILDTWRAQGIDVSNETDQSL